MKYHKCNNKNKYIRIYNKKYTFSPNTRKVIKFEEGSISANGNIIYKAMMEISCRKMPNN